MRGLTFRGALGIAKLGLRKQWFLIVWIVICTFVFRSDYLHYKKAPQYYYLRRILGLGVCVSRGTAALLNVGIFLLVLPMGRSFLSLVRSFLPTWLNLVCDSIFPSSKTMHLIMAITILVTSVAHSASHLANAFNFSRNFISSLPEVNMASYRGENPALLIFTSVPGITGVSMLLILGLLSVTSLRCVRTRQFEVFYYTHHCCIIFLILLLIHPLSGVLKRVQNVDSHPPGCLYRKPTTAGSTVNVPMKMEDEDNKNVGKKLMNFGSPYSVSGSYKASEKTFSSPKLKKTKTGYSQQFEKLTGHSGQIYESHGYAEPSDELFGFPEPSDEVLGFPEPADEVFGFPEPSDQIFGFPELSDEVVGFPEPSDEVYKSPKFSGEILEYPEQSGGQSAYPTTIGQVFGYQKSSDKIFGYPETSNKLYRYPETLRKVFGYGKTANDNDIIYPESFNEIFEVLEQSDETIGFPEPSDSIIGYPEPSDEVIGYPEPSDEVFGYLGRSDDVFEKYDSTANSFKYKSPIVRMKADAEKGISKHVKDSPRLKLIRKSNLNWLKKRKYCNKPPLFVTIQSNTWLWVLMTFMYLLLNYIIKHWRGKDEIEILRVTEYPADVLEITLRKTGFYCNPGQFVLLRCPKVSRYEWHPFTVAKCPMGKSGHFTILMRTKGNWCKKLKNKILQSFLHPIPTYQTAFLDKVDGMNSISQPKNSPTNSDDERDKMIQEISSVPPLNTEAIYSNTLPLTVKYKNKRNLCKFEPLKKKKFNTLSTGFGSENVYSLNRNKSYTKNYENSFSDLRKLKFCINSHHLSKLKKSLISELSTNSHDNKSTTFNIKSRENAGQSQKVVCPMDQNHDPHLKCFSTSEHWETLHLNSNSNQYTSQHKHSNNTEPSKQKNFRNISHRCSKSNVNRYHENQEAYNHRDSLHSYSSRSSSLNQSFKTDLNNSKIKNYWTKDHSNSTLEESEDRTCNSLQSSIIDVETATSLHPLRMFFDGPYSSPNEAVLSYPVVIGVAGGIGVTPLLASLNYLINSGQPNPRRLHVVWVLRELELILPLAPFFQSLFESFWARKQEDRLELRLHYTRTSPDSNSIAAFQDKYPFLEARLYKGRPNWDDLFDVWKESYKRSEVGVFCCGPKSLNTQINQYTFEALGQGLNFNYHHESFS